MSRPKYYWYGIVKKMIMSYRVLKNERSVQATIISHAYEDAIAETVKLPDGDLRVKAINDILVNQRYSLEGEADEVGYSARTVQRWINSFINLVGKKAGY